MSPTRGMQPQCGARVCVVLEIVIGRLHSYGSSYSTYVVHARIWCFAFTAERGHNQMQRTQPLQARPQMESKEGGGGDQRGQRCDTNSIGYQKLSSAVKCLWTPLALWWQLITSSLTQCRYVDSSTKQYTTH